MIKGMGKSELALVMAKYCEQQQQLPKEDCPYCKGKNCVVVGARTKGCLKCTFCEHWTMEGDIGRGPIKMKNKLIHRKVSKEDIKRCKDISDKWIEEDNRREKRHAIYLFIGYIMIGVGMLLLLLIK